MVELLAEAEFLKKRQSSKIHEKKLKNMLNPWPRRKFSKQSNLNIIKESLM